jgi:hypothetical protein
VRGLLKYNTDLFDAPTIVRLIGHFQRMIEDRRHIQRLERSVKRLTWLMVLVCLLLAIMAWQMSGIIVSALLSL